MRQNIIIANVGDKNEVVHTIEVIFTGIEPKLLIVEAEENID